MHPGVGAGWRVAGSRHYCRQQPQTQGAPFTVAVFGSTFWVVIPLMRTAERAGTCVAARCAAAAMRGRVLELVHGHVGIRHFGIAKTLNWLRELFAALCARLGIKKTHTTPLHPQAGGAIQQDACYTACGAHQQPSAGLGCTPSPGPVVVPHHRGEEHPA